MSLSAATSNPGGSGTSVSTFATRRATPYNHSRASPPTGIVLPATPRHQKGLRYDVSRVLRMRDTTQRVRQQRLKCLGVDPPEAVLAMLCP
ncbi:hypothetical protein [Micromonospora foliorum]|uniref:hypothetical protein n=1 Tax=Micromonospora foliorum TaxID=2911210 RepID=UPI0027E1EBA5|nr:hypothetical protein [Micromonospora foliorum]